MNQIQINAFDCITKPQVVSTWPIYDWLNNIKSSPFADDIIKARRGELDYNTVKFSLPCVTYNFVFDGYKSNKNIIESTGLIYIDVDDPSFDITSLDTSKVFSYYHSFGGLGYSILVKASGITTSNFSSTYNGIVNDLGLSEYVDTQAIKATQFNVLSFDENIFINQDSFTYSPIAPPSVVIENQRREAYTIDGGAKSSRIRFNNLDEIEITGDHAVNWDGYDTIQCFIPMKKREKNRNNMLLSYCNNLVYLNPQMEKSKAIDIMMNVNKVACSPMVDEEQVCRVVDSCYRYKEDGTFKPHYSIKKRKIVFSNKSKLSRLEKLEVCRGELIKRWSDVSLSKLYSILESWDFERMGKIAQRKVYDNHPIAKKTVEKYWHHFKEWVTVLNEEYGTTEQTQ